MFPRQFIRAKSFPSFDLHDFDTVDDGVWEVNSWQHSFVLASAACMLCILSCAALQAVAM